MLMIEGNKLTTTETTREWDVKSSAQPLTESQRLAANWNSGPGLEAAVSVHIEAEETAITNRSSTAGIK